MDWKVSEQYRADTGDSICSAENTGSEDIRTGYGKRGSDRGAQMTAKAEQRIPGLPTDALGGHAREAADALQKGELSISASTFGGPYTYGYYPAETLAICDSREKYRQEKRRRQQAAKRLPAVNFLSAEQAPSAEFCRTLLAIC